MTGIFILDKPEGFTSFDAVAVLRRLSKEKKIGHTGTLDPLATGVLPLLLGRAAKALQFLPDTDKEYQASFRLGERRVTGDVTGTLVEESQAPVSPEALQAVLPAFREGCRTALGLCWKSGVAAEVIGLPDGSIGDALYRAKITLSTGELFAWTFVIICLSAAFEKGFLALLGAAVRRVCGEEQP